MRLRHSRSATALAVVLAFAASVRVHSQEVQKQPPVVVANPETKLDITPAATPIVNIAKPREDGTSYNVFTRLNVGREGLIFNNSAKIGSTILGGQILANPNLVRAGTSARLILNEVIGGTRSDLNGPIEIFGPKAGLIIANQAGITCDGCGFFNVERATLTTGRAKFDRVGAFSGLSVNGGAVNVTGKGLLAGNVDYFDIVAETTTLNASLYASDLLITGGNSEFDYKSRTASGRDTATPKIAIDSSLLGGMYANRIRLVGNGTGVGINLSGVATALEGPLEITAGGDIVVRNAVAAASAKIGSSNGSVEIADQLYAGADIRIDAASNLEQKGKFLAANRNLDLIAGGSIHLNGTGIFAGLGNNGSSSIGAINIRAADDIKVAGVQAVATQELNSVGRNIEWASDNIISAAGIDLTARENLNLNSQIRSSANLDARARVINISGTASAENLLTLNAAQLSINGDAVGVRGATVSLSGALQLGPSSSLQSGGALNISAGLIENLGQITGIGATKIQSDGDLKTSGSILAGDTLALNAGGNAFFGGTTNANSAAEINIGRNTTISGFVGSTKDLSVSSAAIAHIGTVSSGGTLSLQSAGALDTAAQSFLVTDKALTIISGSASLGGYASAGGAVNLTSSNAIQLAGQLHASGALAVKSAKFVLTGAAITNAAADLLIGASIVLDGTLSAEGNLRISADRLTSGLTSQIVSARDVSTFIASEFTHRGVLSGGSVAINSGSSISNDGLIFSKTNLAINSRNELLHHGTLEAEGSTTINSDTIISDGRIVGIAGVDVAGSNISFGQSTNFQSGGAMQINAAKSLSTDGFILAVGRANINSAEDFVQNAVITVGEAAMVSVGGRFAHNGKLQAGGGLDVSGASIESTGQFASNGDVLFQARDGKIDIGGNLTSVGQLTFRSPTSIFLHAIVESGGLLELSAKDVVVAGTITTVGGISGSIGQKLSILTGGQMRSAGEITFNLSDLENSGLIASQQKISVLASRDIVNSGELISEKAASLAAGRNINQNAVLQAGGSLAMEAGETIVANGSIFALGSIDLKSEKLVATGILATDDAINITTFGVQGLQSNAIVFGKSGVSLNSGGAIDLKGQLSANGLVSIQASDSLALSGLVESAAAINLSAANLVLPGTLKALGNLSADIQQNIVLTGSISALGPIALAARTMEFGAGSNITGDDIIALNATGVASLSGIISSGKDITIDAGDIQHSGQTLANGMLSLIANDRLEHSGDLQSGSSLSMKAGSLDIGGTTLGIGKITLAADTINVAGALSSNDVIESISNIFVSNGLLASLGGINITTRENALLTAQSALDTNGLVAINGQSIGLEGRIVARNGLAFAALQDFSNRGELLTGGALQVSAGKTAFVSGKVAANGQANLAATDAITLSGDLSSVEKLSIAGRSIKISGTLSGGNAMEISAFDGIEALLSSSILSDGPLSLNSSGAIVADGVIASNGNINLLSDSSLLLGGTLSAGGNIDSHAKEITTVFGAKIVANDKLSFRNEDFLRNAGTISAGSVEIQSGTIFTNTGNIFADQKLTIAAADIFNAGLLSGNGAVSLSGENISFARESDIQVGGILTVSATDTLETNGNLLAINGAELSASRHFVQNATIRLGEGGGRLVSEGILLQNGVIESNGNLSLLGKSIIGVGALLSAGSIAFEAGANGIDYSGNISATDQLVFTAPSTIRLSGSVLTDGIAQFDTETLILGGIVSAAEGLATDNVRTLNIGASGGLISGRDISLNYIDFNNLGTIASNGRLDITASGQGVNSGTLSGVNGLTITTGGAMVLDGLVQSEGPISLVGGSIDVDGTLISIGSLGVSSAGDVNVTGLVSADQTAHLTARDFLIGATGRVVGGDALTVNASSRFENQGIFAAEGAINIASGAVSTLAGSTLQSANSVTIRALGDIGLDGALHANEAFTLDSGANLTLAGIVTSNDAVSLLGKNIGITGTVQADKILSVVGESITNLGSMVGVEGIAVQATTLVSNEKLGRILSDGLIHIESGNLQTTGLIQTGGDLEISVGGLADLGGTLLADNDFRVDAANISTGAIMQVGRNADFVSRGNLEIGSAADIVVTQALTLSSLGNFSNAGLVGSLGTIGIDTGGVLQNTGSLLSTAALTLQGGSVTLSGIVNSNDVIDVSATNKLTIDGTVSARLTGTLSAADIEIGALGRLAVAGNLTLIATDLIHNTGTVVSDADMSLATGGDGLIGGVVSAGGNLSFDAARDLDLEGQIFARKRASGNARDVTVNGLFVGGAEGVQFQAHSFALGYLGDIQSGGLLDIAATNSLVTDGQLLAVGDLKLTAQNATLAGTIAANKSAILVSENAIISGAITGLEGIDLGATGLMQLTGPATLASKQVVRLGGDIVSAAGKISGEVAVLIDAVSAYSGTGKIQSLGQIDILSGGTLVHEGVLAAIGNVTLSGAATTVAGIIDSAADVTVEATDLTLTGQISAKNTFVDAHNIFTSQNSLLVSEESTSIFATGTAQLDGTIGATDALTINATGDLNVTGVAQSLNGDAVLVGRNIAISGNIFSGNKITVTAGQSFTLSSVLSAKGVTDIQAQTIDLSSTGRLLGDNMITLRAADSIANAGEIGSGKFLELSATQSLTNSGTLSSGEGMLLSSALVHAGGTIETSRTLTVGGGSVNVVGTLLSAGALSLNSAIGDIHVDGTLTSLESDVTLTAARDVIINAQTSAKKIMTANARDVIINAILFGEDQAAVTATRDIAIGSSGVLASDGRVDVGFGGNIDLLGTISAGADLSLITSQDLTLGGTLISGGALTVGGRDVTLNGVVVSKDGMLANGRNITVGVTGDIQSEHNLNLIAAENLAINGDILTLGTGNFSANSGIQIASGAHVQGRGDLSFLSAGSFTNAGIMLSEAAISANATAINNSGNLISGGALSLTAGNTLVSTGLLSADEGDIILNAANAALGGEIFGGENVRLRGGSALITGTLTGFRGVDLETTGALSMAGTTSLIASDGLIRLSGGTVTTAGTVNSNAAISILAGSAFQGGGLISAKNVTISSNGTLNSGKISSKFDINLSGLTTRINGIVESEAAVTVGGANLTVDGSLAGTALTLNGGSITTNVGSALLSGGTINFAATGAVSTGGSIESFGAINIGAGTTLTQNGTLRSGGNIDLTAGGLLTSNGVTEAVGALKLRGGSITTGGTLLSNDALSLTSLLGDIAVNAAINSAKSVAINSARDVNLNAIVFGETGATFTAQGNLTLAANGGLASDAALTLNARNLNNAGILSAGVGGMTANFSGSVTNGGVLLSGGGLTLNSGAFSSTSTIQAKGPITLTASNAIISGQVGSDADVTIRTIAGALNVNGDIFGKIVNLDTGGGNLQLGQTGFVQAQTRAKLTTSANAIIDGDLLSNGLVEILATNGALNTGVNSSIRTGGAANFAAKNALTHLGNVEAVGDITLSGGSIASNILLSDGAITLTATGPVAINGETSARNLVDIKSTGSTLTVNSTGLVRSQIADVKLTSAQPLRNDGSIVGQTGINASAGGSVLTNNGQIIANEGALGLTAGQLNLGGTIFGNALLNLNGATINVTGNVGAETSLSVSGGNLTIGTTGLLQSNGAASLTNTGLTVNGMLRTLSGNLVVSGPAINVNNGGRVESGGALNMIATGTVTNNGLIVSGGALSLSGNVLNLGGVTSSGATASFGGGALNISGLVEARGQVTINNGAVNLTTPSGILRSLDGIGMTIATLSNAGSIEAVKPITINASAGLSSSGTIISNQGLTLQTGGVATLDGSVISGGALSVTGATISQSGQISAVDNLSLIANSGGMTIGGTLVGQKAVNLNATGQAITFNPAAEIFGRDSVSASASNITNAAKILSPGTVTLNATNVLTQSGQVVAGGLANLTGGSNIELGGQLDAGAVALNAPIINVTGSLVANGAVTLNANNSVTVSGTLSGGSFALNGAGTDFRITAPGRVVSGGNVALTGIKNLTVDGLLSAVNNVTATYSGVANVSGRIEAGDDITLTSTAPSGAIAGATLIVPGQIIAGRDLFLNGGATTISGTVYGDRNVSVSTSSYFVDASQFAHSLDVTGAGKLGSGEDLNVNVIGDLNVVSSGASILAGGNATLNALTHNISGQITANGKATFTNRGDLVGSGGIALSDFGFALNENGKVQSGGALTIAAGVGRDVKIGTGASLISNDRVIVTGTSIDSLGTVAAANLVSFTSPGSINLGGLVQSGDRIIAHAGDVLAVLSQGRVETIGNVRTTSISRDQGANSNIDLFGGNVLTNSGTIFSDGSVFLGANNALTNLGTITGTASVITQSSNDDIENLGTITGDSLGIFQNIAFHNTGNFVAATNLLIDAPEVFNSGLIGAGNNLTLQSGSSIINTGTLFAGNDLTLSAVTQVHNDEGTIMALGNIAITAAELINDSARIESFGGNIVINSGNVVNRIKDLVIVPAGTSLAPGFYTGDISGSNFFGPVQPTPEDCGNGSMVCFSGGSFLVGTPFISSVSGIGYQSGFYTFFPGSSGNAATIVSNSSPSQIVAAGNVTINGGTNGTVTNRNSSILAGGNINITTGTLNNESTSVQTDKGEVLLPAIIRAGGTVSIVANQINNGTVQNGGGFTGGPNNTFNTDQGPGANGLGGMGSAGGPASQNAGLIGSAGPATSPGYRNGSGNGAFAVGNGPGGTQVGNIGNSGTGADNVSGTSGGGFGPANGNAGNANGVGSGPSPVSGVGGVSDGSVAVGVGGLSNGNGGFDSGAITNGAPKGNQGAIATTGFSVNRVVLQPLNAGGAPNGNSVAGQSANVSGAVINGPADVGSTGPSSVQANVSPTSGLENVAPGGGAGGIGTVGSAPTSVNGSTTTAQSVEGFDGQQVGITSVSTTSAVIGADSSLSGANIPAGQQLEDIQNVSAVGGPQAAATSTNGQATATAALLDGFNGIAIPGIIGANGDAGSFVFDFLRQFDLVSGANGGFGFANGNGLFTFNDSPDADVLFSTNRGFGDFSGLFDSDYFFDQLDIDRATHFTRLGDGFFESQLISQQVRAATQQAQLPQFGTSLAQAEGLMASAVKQQKSLQLSVGVALTAAQVSALTESLVWWVKANVNGREVLVPVVYLAKNDQKSISNGALIAGTNVVANVAGNITNSGTISAANLASLTAGNDFINMSGGLVSGGTVGIKAGNDIVNHAGAAITGGDIFLTAGRDIALSSTVDTTTSSTRESLGRNRFTSESTMSQVATGSTIAATGNLVMNAGRDISISFGNISAGGDAAMVAGRDVLITGVTTTDTSEAAWKTGKNKYGTSSSSEESFHGSVIKVGGDLGISAGRDIGIVGSTIKIGDDLSMQASRGITIGAAETQSSESLNERLSKKVRTNQIDATATTHVLSDISAGGNIALSTPGALTVAGANIAAGDLLAINAGSVRVTGVIDEVSQDTNRVVKSGGLLSSKKTTTVTSMVDQSVIGSTLEGDRVSITSLGDVMIKGSNVVASGNLAINAGGMIDIGTMVEEDSSESSVKVKKSGLSFSGTSLFVGVSKNANTDSATSLINRGSLVGSAAGNVTLNADGAVNIIGSKVVSPGITTIIGDSVTIANATDLVTGVQTSKSSSFGVTATISSPLISSLQALGNMAKTAVGAESSRTAAVAGLAGGLAAVNAADAVENLGSVKDLAKKPTSAFNISVTAGFSKSSSRTDTTDQTVVGSVVTGSDVNIVARGDRGGASSGAINITGSTIEAGRDLMLAATKAITVEAAQEIDTSKSNNKSSGFSAGVVFGPDGISPTVSGNIGKGKSSGTDVTNIESQLVAGGTATIVTPDALVLRGGSLDAERVNIRAGSLTVESLQDTSDFASRQTSIGLNASLDSLAKPTAGNIGGSFNQTREKGSFASVAEQSGISAGIGGFDIQVSGATTLTGGVIDSAADATRNRLATGTLSATDIVNRERYSASQIGLSGSLSDIGGNRGAGSGGEGGTANTGTGNTGTGNTGTGHAGTDTGGPATAPGRNGNAANGAASDGSRVPGIHTSIGTVAAGVPSILGASGGQTGTTHSAIVPAAITITPDAQGIRDAASQAIANTISRDTAGANDGAITQEFDAAKRAEIAKGFEAAKTLTEQTAVFFNNRAAEQTAEEKKLEQLGSRDANGQWQPRAGLTSDQLDTFNKAKTKYNDLQNNFGATSPARLIATALSGAAGGNVAGNLTGLVQGAVVNVLQGLAVNQVKHIADSLLDGQGNPTVGSEAVRAALQGLTACAGAAANGSGNCGSAATGVSASVVLNYLLTEFLDPQPKDANGNPISRTLEDQQARTNLVASLIGAIAAGAGIDPASATNAAQIETENNQNAPGGVDYSCVGQKTCELGQTLSEMKSDKKPDGSPKSPEEIARDEARYRELMDVYKIEDIANASFDAATFLSNLKATNPSEYAAIIQQFGGNEQSAIVAYGLFKNYGKMEIAALAEKILPLFPSLDEIAAGAEGAVGKVGEHLDNFLDDPDGSIRKALQGLVESVKHPIKTADGALQSLSDSEYTNSILKLAAFIAKDDKLRLAVANEEIGTVGAVAVETRLGEAASRGVGAAAGAAGITIEGLTGALLKLRQAEAFDDAADYIVATADVCKHHICTDKNLVSEARGGPWTLRFQKFFDGAGLDISKAVENIANVPGHRGPHPEVYHKYVWDKLNEAVDQIAKNTPEYRDAVVNTLAKIKIEAETPGTKVNNWLRNPS